MNDLDPGKIYMFMTGDGWTFIGRFARPSGLFGGIFTDVVNLCRTGGTAWPELADGLGRDGATFKRWTTGDEEMPFSKILFAKRWKGETPKG